MVDRPEVQTDPRDYPSPNIPSIVVNPRRLALVWSGFVFAVAVVGTLANFGIYHIASNPESNLAKVLRRFDLGHEPSIPNFYSAAALLVAAALLMLIGRLEQRGKRSKAWCWYALAAVFIGLGIDEAVLIHEMINAPIKQRFATTGILFLPWVIVGALFAAVVALVFIPLIYQKSKRTFWLFALAGGVFVFGAVGMEMAAGLIFDHAGSEELGVQEISHTLAQFVEELCEMMGVVIFIYALVDYLSSNFSRIELTFFQPHQQQPHEKD